MYPGEYYHIHIKQSSPVDDPKDVDESHQIYLKDRLLIDKCEETKLLDTWFDILCSYCNRWLKGEKSKLNENFEETKSLRDLVTLSRLHR